MQMRPQIQLQAVIKALGDVVLPAIDPDNRLALEQGKLAIGLLTLLAQQLPVQFAFDCDELTRLIATSGELANAAQGGAGGAQIFTPGDPREPWGPWGGRGGQGIHYFIRI